MHWLAAAASLPNEKSQFDIRFPPGRSEIRGQAEYDKLRTK